MFELSLIGIFVVLLWIGWELHRIAQLAVNFMRGVEDGYFRRGQEMEGEGN